MSEQTTPRRAIWSVIAGVVGLALCWVPIINFATGFLGVIAVVLGGMSVSRETTGRGMAVAGIITGSIGAVLSVVIALIYIPALGQTSGH
jgi:hypothetical protein